MSDFIRAEKDDDLSRQVIQKYMVLDSVESDACVMKYHLVKRELTVGGYAAHIDFIQHIIVDILLVPVPDNVHSQRNKVKYILSVTKEEFKEALELIEDAIGMEATRVLKHGRLM